MEQKVSQTSIQTIIEEYVNAYNQFDVTKMVELVTEDVVFENVSAGEVNARADGIEEFKLMASQSAELFRFRQQTIVGTTFEANQATIDIDYVGELAVDLPNGLKAGQKLELSGKTYFELTDDKISLIRDIS